MNLVLFLLLIIVEQSVVAKGKPSIKRGSFFDKKYDNSPFSHSRQIRLYSRHGFYLTINKHGKVQGSLDKYAADGKSFFSSVVIATVFWEYSSRLN